MLTTQLEPIEKQSLRASLQRSISGSWPIPCFAALVTISIIAWWTSLASLLALALHDDQYTHILLILPVSASLILLEWESPGLSSPARTTFNSALLILAVVLSAVVRWITLPSAGAHLWLSILALVAWWIAAFNFCFGTDALRRSLFPLGFLLCMIPLPPLALNAVVTFLQRGSAAAAHLFFAASGIPVAQRGMLLHIPGLTLEVAPECSSIRSSMMLLVTTMVLAHLLLRSLPRKILIVALAIPLSIAKNGLRIFTLGVLAIRVDSGFLTGRLHREGGIIFFLVALAAIFLGLWILRRGEQAKPRSANLSLERTSRV
jgi:exosortase